MSDENEYDKILFDNTDGDEIIKKYKESKPQLKSEEIKGPTDRYFYISVNRDIKTITDSRKTVNDKHFIFKNIIIIFMDTGGNNQPGPWTDPNNYVSIYTSSGSYKNFNTKIISHNLPSNILFCIKNLIGNFPQIHHQHRLFYGSSPSIYTINEINKIDIPYNRKRMIPNNYINFIDTNQNMTVGYDLLIKLYQDTPKYFRSEDENIKHELKQKEDLLEQEKNKLAKEKEQNGILIKEKQNELDKLILENQQKINHYTSLEQQIIDIQKEKEFIKEEKRKISIAKDKLSQQKRELDDDKFKFELEKDRINDFDIDKFITQKNI
jgi:hypothetical protein